jgi:6-phosphofructo-2-kinase/fructose-2,6-biphosphatase
MNLPRLNEIDSGPLCTGKTYEEVKRVMPEEYAARKADKLGYRYPAGGESYKDVIERVSPIIIELERLKCPVLMVAHQAILRCIYAYFHGSSPKEVPYLDIPLHTVIELQFDATGVRERRFNLEDRMSKVIKPVRLLGDDGWESIASFDPDDDDN